MSAVATDIPSYPIRLGSPAEFQRLRELLPVLSFVQENMEGHFRLHHLGEAEFEVEPRGGEAPASFVLLASLFLQGKSVSAERLLAGIGEEACELLLSLGLIDRDPSSGACVATVAMYATNGLYIVSDRWCGVDGRRFQPAQDVVYPAILGTTRGFLSMIPAAPCQRFLEVCAGTGIAALVAARGGAKHAWAFDIAGRSSHFAEFNRRLNGIENVTVAQGDLYEPAKGCTFDRIVGHPPYVPVLESKYIFYDGGEDGEQITRRMVQDLPRYLESGGLFVCVGMGSDRLDAPFEQRVRSFLGDRDGQFDVALFVRTEMEPAVQALNDVVRGRGSVEQVQRWREILKKLQIVSFVFGAVYIYRHGEDRGGYTIRRTMGKKGTVADVEEILEWERVVARGESAATLQRSVMQATPDCRLHASYVLRGREWELDTQKLLVDDPFRMELDAPGWALRLLSECDGTKTGEQLFKLFQQEEILPAETTFRQFADILTVVISGGYAKLAPAMP